jgi:hypothetical protein
MPLMSAGRALFTPGLSEQGRAVPITAGGAPVAQIDFTADEMAQLQSALTQSSRQGLSLSEWAKDAILCQARRVLMPGAPLGELEIAIYQAVGCIELLKQTCVRQIEEESRYSDEIHRDIGSSSVCGVEGISTQTVKKLREAFREAFDYATGRPVGQGREA